MTQPDNPLLTTDQPTEPTVATSEPVPDLSDIVAGEASVAPKVPEADPFSRIAELEERLAAQGKEFADRLEALLPKPAPEPRLIDLSDEEFNEQVRDEMFINPTRAISLIQERSAAKLRAAQERSAKIAEEANKELFGYLPEAKQLLENPELTTRLNAFLDAEPLYKRQYEKAGASFDPVGRAVVLREFFNRGGTTQSTSQVPSQEATQKVAQVVKPAGVAGQSVAQSTGPVFSRKKIIALAQNDRAKYNSLSNEIAKAFAEGRVTD